MTIKQKIIDYWSKEEKDDIQHKEKDDIQHKEKDDMITLGQ